MEREKSYEELQQEMYEKMKAQGTEYMNEVAMPGIQRQVDPKDVKK